jgi:hypothetical protein
MGINSPKCCFDLITLLQWQRVVTKPLVQGIKNLGLTKGIKDLIQKGMAYLSKLVHLFTKHESPHMRCSVQLPKMSCLVSIIIAKTYSPFDNSTKLTSNIFIVQANDALTYCKQLIHQHLAVAH